MAKKELSKKEQLKQNRKKLAEELSGMHIYKDNHNRYVYYDIFTKNGYVISNVPSYRNYANRFILAAVVGILVYTFDFGKWTLPFALGAALLEFSAKGTSAENSYCRKLRGQENRFENCPIHRVCRLDHRSSVCG